MKRLSYSKEEFAWITWTPADIGLAVRRALAAKKKAYRAIKKIKPPERTFENTIYAIEASGHDLSFAGSVCEVLMNASPDAKVRDAAKRAIDLFQDAVVDIEYDEGMYRSIMEYAAKHETLTGPDKKLFDDMVRGYKRMGFGLEKRKRNRLVKNLKELGRLETQFSKNIKDYRDHIAVTREQLAGLPESYVARLRTDAAGRYLVTMEYPDSIPFMENADDAHVRKMLADKLSRLGGANNIKCLKRILRIRRENAHLLGYRHHADFRTETRMAKNAKTVERFIGGLVKKVAPLAKKELKELEAFKREMTGDSRARIEYYDVAYYANHLRKKTLNVDKEKIREYFPLETVKRGMFEIYEKLFSISFRKLSGYPVWHPDVECYAVQDARGVALGYFFLDLYPRENKYGHCAVFPIKNGRTVSFHADAYVAPYVAMLTNFPKPGRGSPSLMSHEEVVVFFHEFGHIMHGLLTRAPYESQSGTSTARDFVEAPSQMLENWVWDRDMLGMMSGHYRETSRKLPDQLLRGLLAAKNFRIGYFTMRQLVLASFDYLLHTRLAPEKEILTLYRDLVRKRLGVRLGARNLFAAGFGHLNGYDAGYYGYLWSQVYSSDMFTRFEKEGLLNKKTGADYRAWILEKGSSIEELDLVRGFLGREPNTKAFLKGIGLS